MSSQTQFSAQVQVHWIHPVPLQHGKRRQKIIEEVAAARTETTLQVSRSTLNGAWVLVTRLCTRCKGFKAFMTENGHTLVSFPDRIISAGIFTDIANWESPQVQTKCLPQAKDVATCTARFRLGYWCFLGPGSEKTWTTNEERPSHQFADGEWDNSLS